ncbi:phage tail protein [Pseudomonas hygromyciniae]|uniref:Phage tail protein n=1 Tax=Pseudomonas hygromyciniae TaxID=2812000 RepID=A0ABX7JSD6_9PSED|nr:phage tail protein [Pseudomonas hygromyciniae]MBN0978107.1 phage tail protein [Pseudomonas hygromyciniae]QSB38296.1 phage tail protein [Pseudomonas hygromyciniae]
MANITLAGESLIARQQGAKQPLVISRFIFANVPGLNPQAPVDRAAGKPPAGQIVHVYQMPAENAGYVNPNQVVYSCQLGSDLGDWDFNWIGLESDGGVLFSVAYVPLQQKRRYIPPHQVGNNITRNFLVAFDGAQALTNISIDASTWQHDFTVRLAGIDERERLSNRDIFGRACFFGAGLQLDKSGATYLLNGGTAYIEGVRLYNPATTAVTPTSFPTTAWLDVVLQRELSDLVVSWKLVFAAAQSDYTDSAGARHYCVPLAQLSASGAITDLRKVEPIDGPLVEHFAARSGDYSKLRARATTKDDVGLGKLPNAISDDPASDSSEVLASTKALKNAMETLNLGTAEGPYTLVKVNERGQVVSGSKPKKIRELGVLDALIPGDFGSPIAATSRHFRISSEIEPPTTHWNSLVNEGLHYKLIHGTNPGGPGDDQYYYCRVYVRGNVSESGITVVQQFAEPYATPVYAGKSWWRGKNDTWAPWVESLDSGRLGTIPEMVSGGAPHKMPTFDTLLNGLLGSTSASHLMIPARGADNRMRFKLVQMGKTANVPSDGSINVTFPLQFSGEPVVIGNMTYPTFSNLRTSNFTPIGVTSTGFTVENQAIIESTSLNVGPAYWLAIGDPI